MRRRTPLILATVLVLAIAGVGIALALDDDDPPRRSDRSTRPDAEGSRTGAEAAAPTTTTTTTLLPALQPDGTVEAGRPPQFVVISFDGAGSLDLMRHWKDVADRGKARFTFFLSGIYLLDDAHKSVYVGPRHAPGASSVGFANPPEGMSSEQYIAELVEGLISARTAGHEIGTHYNGHFCSGVANPVGSWNAADWTSELDQFSALAANISANNGFATAIPNPVDPPGVIGGRTPCLEGDMDVLYPVLAARGHRYEASRTGSVGDWPEKVSGLWSMTVDSIPLVGLNRSQLSMDYNLFYGYAGAKAVDPRRAAQISENSYQSYVNYFERNYNGNRSPVELGNHFERWNHGAYSDALARFVLTQCVRPEVRCVSYRELVDWLDARTPQQLAAFQAGSFPRMGAPSAPVPAPGSPPAAGTPAAAPR